MNIYHHRDFMQSFAKNDQGGWEEGKGRYAAATFQRRHGKDRPDILLRK